MVALRIPNPTDSASAFVGVARAPTTGTSSNIPIVSETIPPNALTGSSLVAVLTAVLTKATVLATSEMKGIGKTANAEIILSNQEGSFALS